MADTKPEARSHHIDRRVAHLSEDGAAETFALNESFWADLTQGKLFQGGWLVSKYDFSGRWEHWEMHPKGEELIYLLGGAVTFTLERADGEATVTLDEPGAYLIIPRGTWHIGASAGGCSILGITAGDGTEHRPD